MDNRLLDLVRQMETMETAKLSRTVPVKSIEDKDLREFLQYMYDSNDPVMNKVASFINAVICQSRLTFLMSTRIGSDLISEDANSDFKGLNSRTYNTIMYMFLTKTKWFERLREPTNKQAGVLELVQPVLLEMMYRVKGKEHFDAQKKVTLELYDGYEDKDPKPKETKKPRSFSEYLKDEEKERDVGPPLTEEDREEFVKIEIEEAKEESNGKRKNLFK